MNSRRADTFICIVKGKNMSKSTFIGSGKNALAGQGASEYKRGSHLELPYKGKEYEVGDYWILRILSTDAEKIKVIPQRRVKIRNPKNDSMMNLVVADQGKRNKELFDHEGNSLDQCPLTAAYRLPVWVCERKVGGKREEVNKLMFLECGKGLIKSFNALEELEDGEEFRFNENTGRPEYFIYLRIQANNDQIPKKYAFEVVSTGKYSFTNKENREYAEIVLDEFMDEIEEQWDELMEEMSFGTDFDFVQNQLEVRTPKENKQSSASKISASVRPQIDDDEEEEEAPKKKKASKAVLDDDEDETPTPRRKRKVQTFDDEDDE